MGEVILYHTGIESKYCDYELIYEGKPHWARVMGIDIDIKKNALYTCSSDKKFIMTYLSEQNKSVDIETNQIGFTNLYFDRENERLFLTNELGQVNIYLTNEEMPVFVMVGDL